MNTLRVTIHTLAYKTNNNNEILRLLATEFSSIARRQSFFANDFFNFLS